MNASSKFFAILLTQFFLLLKINGAEAPLFLPDDVDESFVSAITNQVEALDIQADGKILAAYVFTNAASSRLYACSRLHPNGFLDESFAKIVFPSGQVHTIYSHASGIYIGGSFPKGLKRFTFSGREDSSFIFPGVGTHSPLAGPPASAPVTVLTVQADSNGNIFAGGQMGPIVFESGEPPLFTGYVARLNSDGAVRTNYNKPFEYSWLQWQRRFFYIKNQYSIDLNASTITPTPTNVIVSGRVTADPYYRMDHFRIEDMGRGGLPGWAHAVGDRIVLGADFLRYTPADEKGFSRLLYRLSMPFTSSSLISWESALYAYASDGNYRVLLGGANPAGGILERRSLRQQLDPTFKPDLDGPVYSVALDGSNKILAGGGFRSVNGKARPGLVRLHGGDVPPTPPVFSGQLLDSTFPIYSIASLGVTVSCMPWPTYQWYFAGKPIQGAIDPGITFRVNFTNEGDYFVVAKNAAGAATSTIARVTATVDPLYDLTLKSSGGVGWRADLNATATPLADGRVILSGTFFSINGERYNGLARFNRDMTLDRTFKPSSELVVEKFALLKNSRLFFSGQNRFRIQTSDTLGVIDTQGRVEAEFEAGELLAFVSATSFRTISLAAQQDEKILLLGQFFRGGLEMNYLVRFLENGRVDNFFRPVLLTKACHAFTYPNYVVLQKTGKILVFGSWSSVNGTPVQSSYGPSFFRLNSDGLFDDSFKPPWVTFLIPAEESRFHFIGLEPDDKILGFFHRSSGKEEKVRLLADGGIDTSFPSALGEEGYTYPPNGNLVYKYGSFTVMPNGQYMTRTRAYLPAGGAEDELQIRDARGNIQKRIPLTFEEAANPFLVLSDGSLLWLATGHSLETGAGVVAPARISVSPAPQVAFVGDNAAFHATAAGFPKPSIQWFFNGRPIFGATNLSLILTNISQNHAGSYSVSALNSSGTDSSPIATLRVLSSQEPVAPFTLVEPKSMVAREGEDVTLQVNVYGSPPPALQWMFQEKAVAGQTNETLLLSRIHPHQAGAYYLLATNRIGQLTVPVQVSVKQPVPLIAPRITSSLTNVGNADTIVLRVEATGSPSPYFQWRLNGANIPGAIFPTITNASSTNSGIYTVLVANTAGAVLSEPLRVELPAPLAQFSDNFAGAPLINELQGIAAGSNGTATVEAGEPQHSLSPFGKSIWFKWKAPTNGVFRFSARGSSFDTLLNFYTAGSNSVATISNLQLVARDDDSGGFYTSELFAPVIGGQDYFLALSGFGGASGRFVLSWTLDTLVSNKPRILQNPVSQSVVLGGEASFSVLAVASGSLSYLWSRGCADLSPGTIATNSILRITNVQPSHVGNYWVTVFNQTGDAVMSAPATLEIGPGKAVSQDKFGELFAADGQRQSIRLLALASPGFISVAAGLPQTRIFDNSGAQTELFEPLHGGVAGGASKWFALTAQTNGIMGIDTIGSQIDTVVAIYTGTNLLSLRSLAFDNNSAPDGVRSWVSFSVEQGQTYFLAVDGVHGEQGQITLNYVLGSAPRVKAASTNQSHLTGQTLRIFSEFEAEPEPTFQWLFNGLPIPGATLPELSLRGLKPGQSGVYTCEARNFAGTTQGPRIEVAVAEPLRLRVNYSQTQIVLSVSGNASNRVTIFSSKDLMRWDPHQTIGPDQEVVVPIDPAQRLFFKAQK